MISWSQAWARIKLLEGFRNMKETDFRPALFGLIITPSAGGTSAATPQAFPGGAIILGITGSAYIPGVAASGQSNRNRQLFGVDFSYTNNESLLIGGPLLADAVLGSGEMDIFPPRELILAPNQQINVRAANYTTGSLTVHIVFHTMIFRFAS